MYLLDEPPAGFGRIATVLLGPAPLNLLWIFFKYGARPSCVLSAAIRTVFLASPKSIQSSQIAKDLLYNLQGLLVLFKFRSVLLPFQIRLDGANYSSQHDG